MIEMLLTGYGGETLSLREEDRQVANHTTTMRNGQ